MKLTKEIISDKYNEVTTEIEKQLGELRYRLIIHHDKQRSKPSDYGFLGDLGQVRSRLQDIINFLPR
jgi:hypothetical protein